MIKPDLSSLICSIFELKVLSMVLHLWSVFGLVYFFLDIYLSFGVIYPC
jgi:hypothetical protein